MQPPPEIHATRKAAAAALGITPRQLGEWALEPWFPADAVETDARGTRCNWDVAAIRDARDAMGRKGSDLSATQKALKLKSDHEKLKQLEIKTRREEREEQLAQGNILPRDELTLTLRELITMTRDRLLTEPAREIAKDFPKQRRRIFDTCERAISKILSDFARQLETLSVER